MCNPHPALAHDTEFFAKKVIIYTATMGDFLLLF